MQLTPDSTKLILEGAHLVITASLLPFAWKIARGVTIYRKERTDFPPHRHTGSGIIYPHGLKPEKES